MTGDSTVALARLDGQAATDAAEAIAFDMARPRQQSGDALAQRRDRAGTTGKEDRVDVLMLEPSTHQQLTDIGADSFEQGVDRRFEYRTCESGFKAGFYSCEVDLEAFMVSQLDLALFYLHRQPVPGALFDQTEQPVDSGGVDDVVAHAL